MLPPKPDLQPSLESVAENKAAQNFLRGKTERGAVPKSGRVKMYNVPVPFEDYVEARTHAAIEGLTLADYYIKAIHEANERRKQHE